MKKRVKKKRIKQWMRKNAPWLFEEVEMGYWEHESKMAAGTYLAALIYKSNTTPVRLRVPFE